MTIHDIKRGEITQTPLLLFDCELRQELSSAGARMK